MGNPTWYLPPQLLFCKFENFEDSFEAKMCFSRNTQFFGSTCTCTTLQRVARRVHQWSAIFGTSGQQQVAWRLDSRLFTSSSDFSRQILQAAISWIDIDVLTNLWPFICLSHTCNLFWETAGWWHSLTGDGCRLFRAVVLFVFQFQYYCHNHWHDVWCLFVILLASRGRF